MQHPIRAALLVAPAVFVACRGPAEAPTVKASDVEAHSLAGTPLRRIVPEGEALERYTAQLAVAQDVWADERSEDAAIWVGRNLAYLGRYQEAIEWYRKRLIDFPKSYRLLRHRGHRYISVRRFDAARADLERAWLLCAGLPDTVEPDGAPNRYGLARSTTQTNILYHLALAMYLQGELDGAAFAWGQCLARCTNDDMRVATLNWLVHALRRAGRHAQARQVLAGVDAEMRVIENFAYHRLLLLQKGVLPPSDVMPNPEDGIQNATAAYGVANWSWCNGDLEYARALLEQIVATTPWNAFGHIAAEADLQRLR